MPDTYYFGLIVTAGAIFVGHWFRWPKGDLHRLLAYTWGVGCMLLGEAIWLLWHPAAALPPRIDGITLWWAVALFAIVAGLATCLGWFIDWVIGLAMRNRINERRPDQSN